MPKESLLSRWTRRGGLCVESRLLGLGFAHGVTTRALGSMKDPANRRRAVSAAGVEREPLVLHQVHGTGIVDASAASTPEPRPSADGWLCAEPGVACGVYVADCLPLYVWDEDGSAAGVFHAGWKGLAAGMAREAVRSFRRLGLGPERLSAAIGPRVGACCYRVGPEVAARFRAEVMRDGRLDLGAEARLQFEESGLPAGRVSLAAECTSCSPEEFFSFRRDKQDSRMLAFIALPGSRGARGS
ncbi:MAG: peptidoglycan editing factor PgeF [Elusimicrobia bacterium]|nr:peptidoglycan editing factor PgeF [Elusimicrobiota bacterium]